MIFTDRTITVRKGESRIDEPIVVYRGDYELEVRFTILNSRFKFMSGTNMIESEKASYGQLAILTPYGGNIFSDIVRCNDGSVTFVLTADMLNQIEEVGLYSFQIRLMDYNKESRVSIPPIEFGIEVREPIASEDHDNSVNNAIVGYSIAKVVDPKEENVGDTFDESGNYNKTNWETGDRISQGKLNKIEDAIDKVNENEINNIATLSKRIDNNFNVLDSTKADTSYVDSRINAVASGSPKGVYPSISALKSSIPNGNENIYITTDNGNWNYWNGNSWVSGGVYQSVLLEDNSVHPNHINGGITTNNLFNVGQLQEGYVNSSTLNIKIDNRYRYAKIPVSGDNAYVIARDLIVDNLFDYDYFLLLDSNNGIIKPGKFSECISGTDNNHKIYTTVVTTSDTSYICMNATMPEFDVAYENGIYVIPRNECPFTDFSFDEVVGINKLFDNNMIDKHARDMLDRHKHDISSTSNNIITDNMTLLSDTLPATDGGLSQNQVGWVTGKIAVESNTTYCIYFASQIYSGSKGCVYFTNGVGSRVGFTLYEDTTHVNFSHGIYIKVETPNECTHMYLALKTPETYNDPYNDVDSIVVTKDTIDNDDIEGYAKEIHGVRVLNPDDLDRYIEKHDFLKQGNLFKDSNVFIHDDALYNSNTELQTDVSGWKAVDVPVIPGKTYYFYSPTAISQNSYKITMRGNIVLLNHNRKIISGIPNQNENLYVESGNTWQVIETTSDTFYIGITVDAPDDRFSDLENGTLIDYMPTGDIPLSLNVSMIDGCKIEADKLSEQLMDSLSIKYNKSSMDGKVWVVVGDSLTEANSRTTKNYHDYVAEELGLTVVNMGRSGTGYKRKEENNIAFYQRILNMPKDADIVTIFGSGNDLSLELGTPNDTGTDTICGCMHKTIQNLYSVLPGVRVGIVLPCPWGSYPPSNKDNKMALYCEALKEIAEQYSIPVLDLYHGSNLRPWDPTFRDLYYKHDDGNTVHPDEDGHALLANKFKMFIQSL